VAERRRNAAREVAEMKKKGKTITPIQLDGRTIARTFWGKAWCDNLESYSDYENRLPRGRTYVRNGSVVDLQIAPRKVTALVSGSSLYNIEIKIQPVNTGVWQRIKVECSGKIDSLIELLQGKLSRGVMEIITRRKDGLFPTPAEISLTCSCPDWAEMCKHVAAALYGVGARLDEAPELLFRLREVDHLDLISQAPTARTMRKTAARGKGKVLAAEGLSDIFGIEIDSKDEAEATPSAKKSATPKKKSTRKSGGTAIGKRSRE
jgi:uncharacterized Zn finger protein